MAGSDELQSWERFAQIPYYPALPSRVEVLIELVDQHDAGCFYARLSIQMRIELGATPCNVGGGGRHASLPIAQKPEREADVVVEFDDDDVLFEIEAGRYGAFDALGDRPVNGVECLQAAAPLSLDESEAFGPGNQMPCGRRRGQAIPVTRIARTLSGRLQFSSGPQSLLDP